MWTHSHRHGMFATSVKWLTVASGYPTPLCIACCGFINQKAGGTWLRPHCPCAHDRAGSWNLNNLQNYSTICWLPIHTWESTMFYLFHFGSHNWYLVLFCLYHIMQLYFVSFIMEIKMISPKTYILHFTSIGYESLDSFYSTAFAQKKKRNPDIKYGKSCGRDRRWYISLGIVLLFAILFLTASKLNIIWRWNVIIRLKLQSDTWSVSLTSKRSVCLHSLPGESRSCYLSPN